MAPGALLGAAAAPAAAAALVVVVGCHAAGSVATGLVGGRCFVDATARCWLIERTLLLQ